MKKYLFSLVIISFYLSGCATPLPPKPDSVTHHYPANAKLSKEQITVAKPINFKQYKMLIVKTSGPILPDISPYLIQSIKYLNIINNVQTPDTVSSALMEEANSNDATKETFLTEQLSTEYGLKQLSKLYGKFLVVDIKIYIHSISADSFIKVFDPENNNIYFAAHYYYGGGFNSFKNIYHPLLNAFADWAKNNK